MALIFSLGALVAYWPAPAPERLLSETLADLKLLQGRYEDLLERRRIEAGRERYADVVKRQRDAVGR